MRNHIRMAASFDEGEVVGVVLFVAGRHRLEMFEFVEEAFDEIVEAIEIGAEGGGRSPDGASACS